MTHPLTTGFLLLALFVGAGCASVPEVESRLRTLQFHPNMYVVQAGDTLESIAFRYRLAPSDIVALNPGVDRGGMLVPGLRINVRPGTELAEAVRTRSGGWTDESGGWADETVTVASEPLDDATASGASASPVVVSPVAIRPAPTPTMDDDVLLARADTERYDEMPRYAPTAPYPREEIVPDDLDIAAADPRAALDEELQRYVGRWTWPTDGAVARGFAPEQPNGQGVDIAGVPGQDVRAALDGTVVYSGRDLSGGGNLVIVRHDDDLMTTYSHTDQLFVTEDDEVLAGDPIASLGWNGDRESVLRFEVRRDGEPLDPMAFLPATP